MNFYDLSEIQQKLLKRIVNYEFSIYQVAGYKRIALLSAARSLARKGLLGEQRTGSYYATELGEKLVEKIGRLK